MASNDSFPVTTRQASRVIAGFPTEIMMQFFQDKTVVFVNQGKIGRMLQISPSTSNRRRTRQRRDPFNDEEEQEQQESTSNHNSATDDTFLPPPDASSTITTLFGTSKTEESRQLEQLYASQIAAILFAKSKKQPSEEEEEASNVLMGEAKPVVVALGLKAAFLEGSMENMEEQRFRFKEVMQLVNSAI